MFKGGWFWGGIRANMKCDLDEERIGVNLAGQLGPLIPGNTLYFSLGVVNVSIYTRERERERSGRPFPAGFNQYRITPFFLDGSSYKNTH